MKKNIKYLKGIIKSDIGLKDLAMEEIKNNKIYLNRLKKNNIKKKMDRIIIEIRNGVGGDEASLFASDLKKMYEKFLEKNKVKKRIISIVKTNIGGYKEIVFLIKGRKIYNDLKYESGVHRVQRLPKTESKGRIHTSTCKIAVYKSKKKKNVLINKKDLKIETFKSSGSGGQHVNKTNSAVRIKHLPTNIVVECQKERSQHKNKKYALELIRVKILEKISENDLFKKRKEKKSLLGLGNRNEKIRTYKYKENILIDHRFKFTINKLSIIMNGGLKILLNNIKKYLKNKNSLKFLKKL